MRQDDRLRAYLKQNAKKGKGSSKSLLENTSFKKDAIEQ